MVKHRSVMIYIFRFESTEYWRSNSLQLFWQSIIRPSHFLKAAATVIPISFSSLCLWSRFIRDTLKHLLNTIQWASFIDSNIALFIQYIMCRLTEETSWNQCWCGVFTQHLIYVHTPLKTFLKEFLNLKLLLLIFTLVKEWKRQKNKLHQFTCK